MRSGWKCSRCQAARSARPDRRHRGVGRLLHVRRLRAVDDLLELAEEDGQRVVVLPRDLGHHLVLRHLQLHRVEGRLAQHLGEELQHLGEVLGQAGERGAAGGLADRGLDRRGAALEQVVELVAGALLGAAGAQHLAGQLGEPGLGRRLEARAGADDGGGLDQRQLVVLEQEDDEAVVEHHALRHRDALLGQRRELELVDLLDLRRGGGEGGGQEARGQEERAGRRSHRPSSGGAAAAGCGGGATVSMTATVRLTSLNTSLATRRMSALVTLSSRSIERNSSRQSP